MTDLWPDSDEDDKDNLFDEMVGYMRARGLISECSKCGYCCVLRDNPCPECERIAESNRRYREYLAAKAVAEAGS